MLKLTLLANGLKALYVELFSSCHRFHVMVLTSWFFRLVSRISARSEQFDMLMHLDVNTEILSDACWGKVHDGISVHFELGRNSRFWLLHSGKKIMIYLLWF